MTIKEENKGLFKPSRFLLSIYFGALSNRFDLPLLKKQDVLVHCKDREETLNEIQGSGQNKYNAKLEPAADVI